jgi:hypothetical protein
MALIFYTYTRVIKVLWHADKRIALEEDSSSTKYNNNNFSRENTRNATMNKDSFSANTGNSAAMAKMKQQLISRRKAAKMLISVAILFAICYLPIHLLNILR